MNKKTRYFIMVLIGIALFTVLNITVLQDHHRANTYTNVAIEGKSEAELQKELQRLSKEKQTALQKLAAFKQQQKVAKDKKKELPALSKDIEDIKKTILDIQKQCLYVGKYICKVNTCQTNPDDENYSVFLNVTKQLENAKQDLFQANDAYDQAKKASSKTYAEKIRSTKELIKNIEADRTRIEQHLK